MKNFSKIEISVIKSTAKNVAPFVAKKAKVDAQIEETKAKIQKTLEEKLQKLEAEKAGYQSIIDSMNGAVKQITNGYTTEELVDVKKEATGQMDQKTGKEIFKTVYVLKYPETVVPPTTEGAGSDFDKDAETFQQPGAEGTEGLQNEEPEGMAASMEPEADEMPEEVMAEKAQVAEETADADPFAGIDANPFNQ